MAQIPGIINGVNIEFNSTVVNDVHQSLVDGLSHCIRQHVALGHVLTKIYISSAFDSHQYPSRHMQHKAVDISRINGKLIAIEYPEGGPVAAIVDAMQKSFETYGSRRENFGPLFKKKLGQPFQISGHKDHIHFSVN